MIGINYLDFYGVFHVKFMFIHALKSNASISAFALAGASGAAFPCQGKSLKIIFPMLNCALLCELFQFFAFSEAGVLLLISVVGISVFRF
jgi:hypothetical protein